MTDEPIVQQCPTCQRPIARLVKSCPTCGQQARGAIVGKILLAIIALFIVGQQAGAEILLAMIFIAILCK